MSNEPAPIDTSAVELTPDVLALTELLARHTHDIWAMQRMGEGWRFGPRRDDALKEHPLLVPYEELPESEKQYDRNTAFELLKVLLVLGGNISMLPKAGEQ